MNVDLESGFLIGDYEVKPLLGQITGPGGSVHIQPKAMKVLLCLAERAEEVVPRDRVIHRVWGTTGIADDALSHSISKLRHALDDHRDNPKYIETIHSRGYRLLTPVTPSATERADSVIPSYASTEGPSQPQAVRRTSIWAQLKRRNVVQVSISYAVVGWIIIEVASTVFPELPLPEWSVQLVILLTIAGFPIAVIMAWALQITPAGVVVDPSLSSHDTESARRSAGDGSASDTRVLAPGQLYRFWFALAICVVTGISLTYYYIDTRVNFSAREWVVLGDFENKTSDASLGQGLALAFRIGLEQSRYANVLPRSAARRTLNRMQRDPDLAIDRAIGVEIAQREQARALVLGSVVEVGGVYSLAAVIVDPASDKTISIEIVNAGELKELLNATEQLTTQVRSALGESLGDIEETSIALEKVTTRDLDALKAYSAGVQWANRGRGEEAVRLLQRAIELDPEFAMAHASLGTVYRGALEDGAKAFAQWDKALAYSNRLTQREQVYIKAARTWHGSPKEMIRAWSLMSSLYPDQASGHHNLGLVYWEFENDLEKAREAFQRTVALPTSSAPSYYYLGYCHLAFGELEEAQKNFETGWELDRNPMEFGIVDLNVVLGRYEEAESFINENLSQVPPVFQFEAGLRRVGYYVDQGRFGEGLATAEQTLEMGQQHSNRRVILNSQAAVVAVLERKGDSNAFQKALEEQISGNLALLQIDPRELDYSPLPQLALLGKIAARNQRYDLAQQVLDAISPQLQNAESFVWESYGRLLRAELQLGQGRGADAIATVQHVIVRRDLFQAHESLARAYTQLGDIASAIEHYEWMTAHRGLAFAESLNRFYGKDFNIVDWSVAWVRLAALRSENGDHEGAAAAYEEFLGHWHNGDADLPILQEARSHAARPSITSR